MTSETARTGLLHHVELWVPGFNAARPRWQWLLNSLGYQQFQLWDNGVSYQLGPTYIVLEQSPALIDGPTNAAEPGSTTSLSTPAPAGPSTIWSTSSISTAGNSCSATGIPSPAAPTTTPPILSTTTATKSNSSQTD